MTYEIYNNESDLPDNVIAIDGIVYLLDGWKHPGGNKLRCLEVMMYPFNIE